MPSTHHITPRWILREPPLSPVAVACRGESAQRLAHRVLELDDETLQKLGGVTTHDCIVLLGESDDLPWVDGAIYFGRDQLAPSLLLPTTQTLDVPLDIFERAIATSSTRSNIQAPFAVFADGTVISLFNARPISREVLRGWMHQHGRG